MLFIVLKSYFKELSASEQFKLINALNAFVLPTNAHSVMKSSSDKFERPSP
ncbi:hypothetical protein DSECCO2_368200 [anaerobic digester metagenome]